MNPLAQSKDSSLDNSEYLPRFRIRWTSNASEKLHRYQHRSLGSLVASIITSLLSSVTDPANNQIQNYSQWISICFFFTAYITYLQRIKTNVIQTPTVNFIFSYFFISFFLLFPAFYFTSLSCTCSSDSLQNFCSFSHHCQRPPTVWTEDTGQLRYHVVVVVVNVVF